MRDRMERFTAFPFSIGCISHSSVKVVTKQSKKLQAESSSALTIQSNGKAKSSVGRFLPLPKPNISAGIQKVIKSFKNLSSLFHFYNKDEDGDEEWEMEIGFPTDVQHVGHIGWDGFNGGSATAMKNSRDKVDSKIKHMGISITSRCNCCIFPQEETVDHLFVSGSLANCIWSQFSTAGCNHQCPVIKMHQELHKQGEKGEGGQSLPACDNPECL